MVDGNAPLRASHSSTNFFTSNMGKTPGGKKSGKSSKKGAGGRRNRRRVETFSSYIYKVLKQVHPDVGVSKKAMSIMNSVRGDGGWSRCCRVHDGCVCCVATTCVCLWFVLPVCRGRLCACVCVHRWLSLATSLADKDWLEWCIGACAVCYVCPPRATVRERHL